MAIAWTPERLEELRRLAAEGATFTEAAQALGCSRSAIAGAADRAGVSFSTDLAAKLSRASLKTWETPGYRERAVESMKHGHALRRGG